MNIEKNIISSEFQYARRENGLTIRYLAQCLINDLVFPKQDGIITLLKKCRYGNYEKYVCDFTARWEYWFLFHLEDFGSGDKSEIDVILRNGNTLFPIEVKAFTNPNATDVKREIIRNYFTLHNIINSGNPHFSEITSICPILLYSLPVYETKNPSSDNFNYFNTEFLYKKGYHHKDTMDVCSSRAVSNPLLDNEPNALSLVKNISNKLLFISWDDILECIIALNQDNKYDDIISELINRKDYVQNIRLIKPT